jgi:hypothetical protein
MWIKIDRFLELSNRIVVSVSSQIVVGEGSNNASRERVNVLRPVDLSQTIVKPSCDDQIFRIAKMCNSGSPAAPTATEPSGLRRLECVWPGKHRVNKAFRVSIHHSR